MLNGFEETYLASHWHHHIPKEIRVYARKQSIMLQCSIKQGENLEFTHSSLKAFHAEKAK